MLLQLLIPVVTWCVVNVTADINDLLLISPDTSVSYRERCVCPALM